MDCRDPSRANPLNSLFTKTFQESTLETHRESSAHYGSKHLKMGYLILKNHGHWFTVVQKSLKMGYQILKNH